MKRIFSILIFCMIALTVSAMASKKEGFFSYEQEKYLADNLH